MNANARLGTISMQTMLAKTFAETALYCSQSAMMVILFQAMDAVQLANSSQALILIFQQAHPV